MCVGSPEVLEIGRHGIDMEIEDRISPHELRSHVLSEVA